jgi:hypothetical protein
MRYSGEYPKRIEGLTTNNYDVTRWMLADVEWPAYEEIAGELRDRMTDAVIDEAMHQMPAEWYAIDGAQMTKDLRRRRDGIVEYARRFYLHLADRVDVRGSDRDELASVVRGSDGSLDLTLAPRGADAGTPYYRRRFSPKETQEVRLYLLGGDDRLVTSGPGPGGIRLRVLGGPGEDSLDDSRSGEAWIQDAEGRNTFGRGPGTRVVERPWTNPRPEADRPWLEPRGYGHWTVPMIEAWWQPNQEFMLGGGFTRTAWAFRKYPWANQQSLTVLYATGYQNVRATYNGMWRLSDTHLIGSVELRFSGIENMNFYGFGNETPTIEEKARYKTETNEYRIYPALRYHTLNLALHVGAETRVVQTKGGDSLVEQEKVYGSGKFGEAAVRAGIEYDSRGRTIGLTTQRGAAPPGGMASVGAPPKVTGVRLEGEAFYVPKTWDVTEAFGGVDGRVSGYVGNQRLALAARVGGRTLWGTYPWFESASISGHAGGIGAEGRVRGYYDGRFRGDSSLYGNAELRWWIGKRKRAALPLRWGLVGFGETGRVWLDGEDSKKWHTGYGVGAMVQLIGTPMALQGSVANGDEGVRFYVGGGYSF